eukprot:TRINITY_DN11482_c0_g1_i1.p1 TRINITY_DN11482_c0_g1~~TRINITY_DN11482_c0_g1_i1.p1  ORF type:complete len:600 (-),score=77.30 TRINITY_DN11482_c0_g1_i1:464-2263(-)
MESEQRLSLDSLIDDVKRHLFSFLSLEEVCAAKSVCKDWNKNILGWYSSLILPKKIPLSTNPDLVASLFSGLRPHHILHVDLSRAEKITASQIKQILTLSSPDGGSLDRLRELDLNCACFSPHFDPAFFNEFAFSKSLNTLSLSGVSPYFSQLEPLLAALPNIRHLEIDFADKSVRQAVLKHSVHLRSILYKGCIDFDEGELEEHRQRLPQLQSFRYLGSYDLEAVAAPRAVQILRNQDENSSLLVSRALFKDIASFKVSSKVKELFRYDQRGDDAFVAAMFPNDHALPCFHVSAIGSISAEPHSIACGKPVLSASFGTYFGAYCLSTLENGRTLMHSKFSDVNGSRFTLHHPFEPPYPGPSCTAADLTILDDGSVLVAAAYNDGELTVWSNTSGTFQKHATASDFTPEDVVFLKWGTNSMMVCVSVDNPNDAVIWKVSPGGVDRQKSFRHHQAQITTFVKSNFFIEFHSRLNSTGFLTGDDAGVVHAWQTDSLEPVVTYRAETHVGVTIPRKSDLNPKILAVGYFAYTRLPLLVALTPSHILVYDWKLATPVAAKQASPGAEFTAMTTFSWNRAALEVVVGMIDPAGAFLMHHISIEI